MGAKVVVLSKLVNLGVLGAASLSLTVLAGSDRGSTIAQTLPIVAPTENAVPSNPSAPYVSTPQAVVTEMLKLAGVTRDDVVYDLGSGDGRLVITALKDYGARRGVGIESNPGLVRVSNENAQKAGVGDRTQFVQQEPSQTDLHDASVIYLDTLPNVPLKLRPKLLSELKPGTRLVARTAALGDWKPDRTTTVAGVTLYYWVVPERIAGDWQGRLEFAPGRSQAYTLRFTQQFQQVKGDAIADGKKYNIPKITLIGDRLTFSRTESIQGQAGIVQFDGRIAGDTLKGTAGVKWGVLARNFPIVAKRNVQASR